MSTALRVSRAVGSRTSMSTTSTPASVRRSRSGVELDRIMQRNDRLRQLARRGREGIDRLGDGTSGYRQGKCHYCSQPRGEVTNPARHSKPFVRVLSHEQTFCDPLVRCKTGQSLTANRHAYSGLISTLRNLTTPVSTATPLASLRPRPCCSAIRPVVNLASCAPSTVFWPLRTTEKVEPFAVIS